ncbi:Site-specific recombinase XerD [Maribacter dokdonensis]|uniref:tyrosine-type recombinase/integrase n=1 Tax=Maribacter dokdonensis TaxID=320912 RepID=UPI001B255DC0|nr:site-specific integrase [Maribacter dokdonensis]CAG2535035.1 Site-specific recombinase XerD [Maribacter dokdonensis]
MAKVKLILDTRKSAKSSISGLYPVAIRVFHNKTRIIRLLHYTSPSGWNEKRTELKKSVLVNADIDCDTVNEDIYDKLHTARKLIVDLGESIHQLTPDTLVDYIRAAWDDSLDSIVKKRVSNGLMLSEWAKVIIERKLKSNKPGTAAWYEAGVRTFKKFNDGADIRLDDITVTLLKNFQIDKESQGTGNNTISSYMRSVRALYNSAIKEDQFTTPKNPFEHYKIPATTRTKKRAIAKVELVKIRDLAYKPNSAIWHAKNYALIMFNSRGMNFVDLVKVRVKDISGDYLFYGRSKTGDRLTVRITKELEELLTFYLIGKGEEDYLFPANYDGSTKHYEKYKTLRRRMNENLKIIADDVGIEGKFTTYSIRHSWATIAKYMGISTEIISEGLGHHSLKTTEIYLKSFTNKVLDDANELIVA